MTVRACYQIIGNYQEALGRLGSESLMRLLLGKFREDRSFASLCAALDAQDYKQAFMYIHNLKGVYLNLAMTQAAQSAGVLCDALRSGVPTQPLEPLVAAVKRDYQQVIDAITALMQDG